jgi:hypothetical protein
MELISFNTTMQETFMQHLYQEKHYNNMSFTPYILNRAIILSISAAGSFIFDTVEQAGFGSQHHIFFSATS